MSDTTLQVKSNGTTYDAWESFHIRQSMLEMSCSFAASTINFHEKKPEDWYIDMNSLCEVFIGDALVGKGYLDDMPIVHASGMHSFEIYGRDLADVVDCSWDGDTNVWIGLSVKNIISRICAEYNIDVVVDDSATTLAAAVVDSFKADEGAVVSEIIYGLCKDYTLLPISLGNGKLTLTTATTTERATDALEVGGNVIYAVQHQNNKDRFSSYKVKGYGIGTDNKKLADYISPVGTATDSIITRNRPCTIFADNPTTNLRCRNRARWEASIRAGYSRMVELKAPDWFQSDGKIWKLNTLVNVRDDLLKLNKTMLIVEIDFVANEDDGEAAFIKTVDKDTFTVNSNIQIKGAFE